MLLIRYNRIPERRQGLVRDPHTQWNIVQVRGRENLMIHFTYLSLHPFAWGLHRWQSEVNSGNTPLILTSTSITNIILNIRNWLGRVKVNDFYYSWRMRIVSFINIKSGRNGSMCHLTKYTQTESKHWR